MPMRVWILRSCRSSEVSFVESNGVTSDATTQGESGARVAWRGGERSSYDAEARMASCTGGNKLI